MKNSFFLENPPEWNFFSLLKFMRLADMEEANKRGAQGPLNAKIAQQQRTLSGAKRT